MTMELMERAAVQEGDHINRLAPTGEPFSSDYKWRRAVQDFLQ
ncbi:hypothetical protein [Tunturiibacter gelidoferens]|uniref:Uncharacterized protein n=1 Tax=Tunturiibacter lichenicola TaxID=2051959 RepID=A0A7Y9NRJ0_9BACT|nr:hypothetical protein [Edaphobacter lichenicola]NYF54067.1 hypothetical protein [Edaphobacter lichenicola]